MADVRPVQRRVFVMPPQEPGMVVAIKQAVSLHMRAHAGTCQHSCVKETVALSGKSNPAHAGTCKHMLAL